MTVKVGFGVARTTKIVPLTTAQQRRATLFGTGNADLVPLGLILGGGLNDEQLVEAVDAKGTVRQSFYASCAASNLRLFYGAFNGLAAAQSGFSVHAALEIGGTLYEVQALTAVASDAALLTAPAARSIPRGEQVWARSYGIPTAGGRLQCFGFINAGGPKGEAYDFGAAGADKVMDGVGTSTLGTTTGANRFGALMLLGQPATATPVIGLFGDSVAHGSNDAADLTHDQGFVARAAAGAIPLVDFSKVAEQASQVVAGASPSAVTRLAVRARYWKMCSQGIVHYGTNDRFAGRTDTQIMADLATFCGWVNADGPELIVCTVPPRTSSTDSWATTVNQTPIAGETFRVNVNQWIRAGCPIDPTTKAPVAVGTGGALTAARYDSAGALVAASSGSGHWAKATLDTATTVESALDSGVWKASITSDGVHPSATGHANMAVPLAAIFPSVLVA